MDAETGNDDVMTYSEELATFPFKFKRKNGNVEDYCLVEMMGDGVSAWMRYRANRVKLKNNGVPDPNSLDTKDFHATLIAKCLRRGDANGEAVPVKEIALLFPASMLQDLFKKCEKMNGLTDEGVEEAKKD